MREWFVIHRLGFCYDETVYHIEVSSAPVPKTGEAVQNVEIWVVWGSHGSLKVTGSGTHSTDRIQLPDALLP